MRWLLLLLLVGCATGQAIYTGSCPGLCFAEDGVVVTSVDDDSQITLEYLDTEAYGLLLYSEDVGLFADFSWAVGNITDSDTYALYYPSSTFNNVTLAEFTVVQAPGNITISYLALNETTARGLSNGSINSSDLVGDMDEATLELDFTIVTGGIYFYDDGVIVETDIDDTVGVYYGATEPQTHLILRTDDFGMVDSGAEDIHGVSMRIEHDDYLYIMVEDAIVGDYVIDSALDFGETGTFTVEYASYDQDDYDALLAVLDKWRC